MATSPAEPSIKDAKLISTDTFNAFRATLGNLLATIEPGQKWEYSWFGNQELYYPESLEMGVFVYDNEPTSPTFGFYIRPDSTTTYGWRENGSMIVVNNHTAARDYLIRPVMYMRPVGFPPG